MKCCGFLLQNAAKRNIIGTTKKLSTAIQLSNSGQFCVVTFTSGTVSILADQGILSTHCNSRGKLLLCGQ